MLRRYPWDLAVEFDQWYHEHEAESHVNPDQDHRDLAEKLTQITALLKRAGATSKIEIDATAVGAEVRVFASYPTGLFTDTGNLSVHRLPGAAPDFREHFERWRAAHFDPWPATEAVALPAGFDRTRHIAEGRQLAREIKQLVGPRTAVEYLYLSPEAEARGERVVDCEQVSS